MQTVQGMHAVLLSHHIENESIMRHVSDSIRDHKTSKRERQLPKLNVAGSIPVSRSNNQRHDACGCKPLSISAPSHPTYLLCNDPVRRSS